MLILVLCKEEIGSERREKEHNSSGGGWGEKGIMRDCSTVNALFLRVKVV